ncbi:ribonuclease H2, subunit B [Aspergillus heterothallicus]
MRTRSAPPSEPPVSDGQSQSHPSNETFIKPSKAFILPFSADLDGRFITLPHPQTGDSTRYFFCPKSGLYEFTVVAPPAQFPRSILYTSKQSEDKTSQGTISKAAELLVATPIDIVFFAIPLLCSSPSSNEGKKLFQPLDDIIDSQDNLSKQLRYILYHGSLRDTLLRRVEDVCDSVEAGGEKMFRMSEAKLLRQLLVKAERMVAQGLPTSLEERFVKQVLAAPLMSVTRTDITTDASSLTLKDEDETGSEGGSTSQSTATTITTSSSASASTSASTPIGESSATPAREEVPDEQACPESIVRLQRLSTAFSFLKSTYLSPELGIKLDGMLSAHNTPVDFKPLHDHLKHLAELRAEALASRSFGDFSHKRNAEDDDAAEARAEKKRRKEEEEKKKKAGESRGVRELKKVDTTGMKKMSDFFGKAAAKKKP